MCTEGVPPPEAAAVAEHIQVSVMLQASLLKSLRREEQPQIHTTHTQQDNHHTERTTRLLRPRDQAASAIALAGARQRWLTTIQVPAMP